MRKIDGFDEAVIGVAEIWQKVEGGGGCRVEVIVYDADRIQASLMEQGMTHEEAAEYMEFNIAGAYMGPDTPVIVHQHDYDLSVLLGEHE